MRFSSLLFALPFVATAFAAPYAKSEPISVAELKLTELVTSGREAHAPYAPVILRRGDNTTVSVTQALEELVDGLLDLVPNHPLNVAEDIEVLVKDVTLLFEGAATKLGFGAVNPVIDGIEDVFLVPVSYLLGRIIVTLGLIFTGIDLDIFAKIVNISIFKHLFSILAHSLLKLFRGLDGVLPGLLPHTRSLLVGLLGPLFGHLFDLITHAAANVTNTFFGAIPGVTDLLKALGLLN